jgi:hypothetical protein
LPESPKPSDFSDYFDFMKNDYKTIELENLPFEIKIRKPKKHAIKIPAWLAALIPIIAKERNLIQKLFHKNDQKDIDIKLIKSILEELSKIKKDNDINLL